MAPVAVAVSNAMSPKDSFPGLSVPTNSGVEVTKDQYLVGCGGAFAVASEGRSRIVPFLQVLPEE